MEFEWDSRKSASNLEKHGVNFEEAAQIFASPVIVGDDSRRDYGESRCIAVGMTQAGMVVIVVFTERSRIISARKANSEERQKFYEHIKKEGEKE